MTHRDRGGQEEECRPPRRSDAGDRTERDEAGVRTCVPAVVDQQAAWRLETDPEWNIVRGED
ncbi:hypothetical protein NKH77_46055 [Streptomyces sp. M19]